MFKRIKRPGLFVLFLLIIVLIGIFIRVYSLSSQYLEYDESVCMVSGLKFHHESFKGGKEFASDQPPLGKYTFGIFTAFDKKNDYSILKYIPSNMYVYATFAYQLVKINLFKLRLSAAIIGILIIFLSYILSFVIYRNHNVSLIVSALIAISSDLIAHSRFVQMSLNAAFGSVLTLIFYLIFVYKDKKYKYPSLLFFGLSYIYTLNSKLWPTFVLSLVIGIHYLIVLYYRADKEDKLSGKVKYMIISSLEFIITVIICLILTYYFINPMDAQTYRRAGDISFGNSFPYFIMGLVVRNSYVFLFLEILAILYMIQTKEKKKFYSLKTYSDIKYFPLLFLIVSLFAYGLTNFSEPYKFRAHFYGYMLNTFIVLMIGLGYICYKFIYESAKNIKFKEILISIIFFISLVSILYYFPLDYYKYANFGVSTDYRNGYASVGWHSYPFTKESLEGMFKEYKDKIIFTNEWQFLVFFPSGQAYLYPFEDPSICNEAMIKEILDNKDKFLFIDFKDFYLDPYRRNIHCKKLLDQNFTLIRIIKDSETVDESIRYVYKLT